MINSCKKIDPVEQGENGFDGAESVMINGANGDVYVSGESTNQYSSVSLEDLFTIRYDAAGNVLDSVLGGSATYRDFVKEIGRDFANHLFLLLYDLSGNYMTSMYNLNLTIYGGIFMSAGYIHEPTEFSVDAASNKYFGIDEVNGFRIIKIDQNNLTVWSRNFQRTPTSTDEIKCIVADNNGNSYIAASTLEAGETDLWLLKVNSSGDTVWTKTWGIENGSNDIQLRRTCQSFAFNFHISKLINLALLRRTFVRCFLAVDVHPPFRAHRLCIHKLVDAKKYLHF